MIELIDVTVQYGSKENATHALRGVNAHFESQEFKHLLIMGFLP